MMPRASVCECFEELPKNVTHGLQEKRPDRESTATGHSAP